MLQIGDRVVVYHYPTGSWQVKRVTSIKEPGGIDDPWYTVCGSKKGTWQYVHEREVIIIPKDATPDQVQMLISLLPAK